MQAVVQRCRRDGHVETLLGRRRHLPNINATASTASAGSDPSTTSAGSKPTSGGQMRSHEASKLRLQAERQAVNSVCQGSAADLIKLAMVNIDHQLSELSAALAAGSGSGLGSGPWSGEAAFRSSPGGGLYEYLPTGGSVARLVLQIHDELIYEVQERHLAAVAATVKHCMEHAVTLCNVPLRVKMHSGASWDNLTPYPPPHR
jgi:DNA polymerase theta